MLILTHDTQKEGIQLGNGDVAGPHQVPQRDRPADASNMDDHTPGSGTCNRVGSNWIEWLIFMQQYPSRNPQYNIRLLMLRWKQLVQTRQKQSYWRNCYLYWNLQTVKWLYLLCIHGLSKYTHAIQPNSYANDIMYRVLPITQLLTRLGMRYEVLVGSMSTEAKRAAVDNFQNNPAISVCVGTDGAGRCW
jgi:hypothetical protein